jgi:hypothetical protein
MISVMGLVGQQRLEHPEAERLVDDLTDEQAALHRGEHRALAAEQRGDDRFQARAALRRPELDELAEVDLVEQLALEERDAGALALPAVVERVVVVADALAVEAVLEAHG